MPMPRITKSKLAPLLSGKGEEIRFHHFSVYVHAARRLPIMAAVNIKGEAYSAETRSSKEPWKHSSEISKEYQIDNRFYGNDGDTFDRGHLVRRVDPAWGAEDESGNAELDTFTWVNCTPQHKKLNRMNGIWLQLEQHIMENGVKNKIADISVLSGPVLAPGDPVFIKNYENRQVPIPELFWKIIVWKKTDGKLYAVGFMMSQKEWIKGKTKAVSVSRRKPRLADNYFENLKFKDNKTYQVPLSIIEKATGIQFRWQGKINMPDPKKPKPVRATSYKQVLAVRDVQNVIKQLPSVRGARPGTRAVNAQIKRQSSLPKRRVVELVNKGESYRLRLYKLSNIIM